MNLVIITDGNNTLGMGHVYQSLTLADTLKNNSHIPLNINFITKSDNKICDLIRSLAYNVEYFSNDDLIFERLKGSTVERVIFDKLDVSPVLAKKIKEELGLKLTIFTNLTAANDCADITVMAGMGSNFKNIYRKDKRSGKVEFFGPKYWFIRPEFEKYQKSEKTDTIKNILLIFGGSDQANLSTSVLEELLKFNDQYTITLVLGSAFIYLDELQNSISKYPNSSNRINIVRNLKNVAETMFNNDLTFVSPGLSFFESLMVGTPVVCFHQNDFQKNAWQNDIVTFDKKDINKISEIIDRKFFYFADSPFIRAMEIGKGKLEIVNEILS